MNIFHLIFFFFFVIDKLLKEKITICTFKNFRKMFSLGRTVSLNQQKKNATKKKLSTTRISGSTGVLDVSNSNYENFQNIGANPSIHTIKANFSKISSFIGSTILPKLLSIDLSSTPLGNEPHLAFMCVTVFGQNVAIVNGTHISAKTKSLAKKYGAKVRPLILEGYLVKSITPKLQIALYNKENELFDFDFNNAQEFLEQQKKIEENEREIQEMLKQLKQQEKPVKVAKKTKKFRIRPFHEKKVTTEEKAKKEEENTAKEQENMNVTKEDEYNTNSKEEETVNSTNEDKSNDKEHENVNETNEEHENVNETKENDENDEEKDKEIDEINEEDKENEQITVNNHSQEKFVEEGQKNEENISKEIDKSFEADEEFLKNEKMFQEEEKQMEEEENENNIKEEKVENTTIKRRTKIPIKNPKSSNTPTKPKPHKLNHKNSKIAIKTYKKVKAFEEVQINEEEELGEDKQIIEEQKHENEEQENHQINENEANTSLDNQMQQQIEEGNNNSSDISYDEGMEDLSKPRNVYEEEDQHEQIFKFEEEEEKVEVLNLPENYEDDNIFDFEDEEEDQENIMNAVEEEEEEKAEKEEPQYDNIEDLQNFDVNARNENGVQDEVDDFIASIQDSKKLIVVPHSTDYDIDLM